MTSIQVYVSDVIECRFEKVKTAIYFVKLVRKRIKQILSGSLEKQSLTLFPVYYDNFSNLEIWETMLETIYNSQHNKGRDHYIGIVIANTTLLYKCCIEYTSPHTQMGENANYSPLHVD